MAYKLITSSKTEEDIENAIKWYLDIEKELARSFLVELKAAINIFFKTLKRRKFGILLYV